MIQSQAAPEAGRRSPRCDPRLLISGVKDPTGCEGVGRAGVSHAFPWVVCSCRTNKHRKPSATSGECLHLLYSMCGDTVLQVSTYSVSVAEMR